MLRESNGCDRLLLTSKQPARALGVSTRCVSERVAEGAAPRRRLLPYRSLIRSQVDEIGEMRVENTLPRSAHDRDGRPT
jgi:hypothetical protein